MLRGPTATANSQLGSTLEVILGLNYNGMHDSSICVMNESGRVVLAISEERFSRVKQDGRFPRRALASVDLSSIDAVGIPYLDPPAEPIPSDTLFRDVSRRSGVSSVDTYPRRWRACIDELRLPTLFFDHHEMHAYTAVYLAGATSAICMTSDFGAYTCDVTSAVFQFESGKLTRIAAAAHGELDALCALYSDVTALLGLTPCMHEGKVTGLAALGRQNTDCQRALLALRAEIYDSEHLLYDWVGQLGNASPPFLQVNSALADRYRRKLAFSDQDVARAAQDILERQLNGILASILHQHGPSTRLVLSGGLFANVKANMEIASLGFESVFVCPAMGDDGLAIGAARAALEVLAPSSAMVALPGRPIDFGAAAANPEPVFESVGAIYHELSGAELAAAIADILSTAGTVAVVRGRQEFGPRALGRRSVLANPADARISGLLNEGLHRTDYMPFAPIIRDVRLTEVFDVSGVRSDILDSLAYMTLCLPVLPAVAELCPAIVHVDGTARPQVLTEEFDADLYRILAVCEDVCGLPAFINTSFNIHNEPLVSTVEDALAAFFAARLSMLVVDNFVVLASENQEMAATLALGSRTAADDVARDQRRALAFSFGERLIDGPGRFTDLT